MKTSPRTILFSFLKNPQNRIANYRNRFAGNRAFIIGNGPSLRDTDLTRLKDEITFGVNNIYLHFDRMGFEPTFYYAEDSTIVEHHRGEINALIRQSIKVFPYVYRKLFKDGIYVNYSPYPPILSARFSTDASKRIFWGGSCSYAVMQLAYFIGVTRLYLVGLDHNWLELAKGGRQTHFAEGYYKPHKKYNVLRHMWIVNKSYRKARQVFEQNGREIINCTVGGNLETFPRQPLEEVLFGN